MLDFRLVGVAVVTLAVLATGSAAQNTHFALDITVDGDRQAKVPYRSALINFHIHLQILPHRSFSACSEYGIGKYEACSIWRSFLPACADFLSGV